MYFILPALHRTVRTTMLFVPAWLKLCRLTGSPRVSKGSPYLYRYRDVRLVLCMCDVTGD